MILGITGGSGCGKTTLLNVIRDQGGLVLDCDAIYHELLRKDPQLLTAISSRFPGTVEDGILNRKKLGSIVFQDPQALSDLNFITHCAVREEIQRRLADAPDLAAIDAIALFEGGLAELCDQTVAVVAPLEARVQRLMARDGISEEYARSRISAQHEDSWFRSRCGCTLENNGTQIHFHQICVDFLRNFGIIKQ